MWSGTNGVERNSGSSDTTGDSSPMELSLNQSMEGLTVSGALNDMLGGSAYAHSLNESNGMVPLTSSQVVEEMDLATSTDEAFSDWLDPPDLFEGCDINPTTSLRIGKEVGNGAFSTIYIGQYKGTSVGEEVVAIKRIETAKKASGKKAFPPQIMFNREVAFLKLLRPFRHPNIIRFIGACAVPPLVITEYLSGGSLFARLHENTQEITLPHRLFIAFGIANGMGLLHEKGIIHRDLTSENVLLTAQDEPKIIDFGFAVQKIPKVDGELFTLRPAGNARWRAPEITRRQPYNRSVDVYSYGIVLNEILSRQVPFHQIEKSRDAAAAATQGNRPLLNFEDRDLQALVARYWADNPSQRPSFETVKRELQNLLMARFNA